MNDIYGLLQEELLKNSIFSSNGEVLKNKVIAYGLNMKKELLELLLQNLNLKKAFFTETNGVLVFDKLKFQRILTSKEFLPSSYTIYKNKIGLQSNDKYLSVSQDISLVWPYKDCVLEGMQTNENEKRSEVFYNQILASDQIDKLLEPKILCNFNIYNKKGVKQLSEEGNTNFNERNFVIKGNNLLTLSCLLERYEGMIKMVYCDPPYNTGSDSFKYNDSFNHSSWLTFMKNRLEVIKKLMRKDGCLFIQCDDNEQAYLKVLCDEVMGRENFICTIPWKGRSGRQAAEHLADIHEFILLYARHKKSFVAGAIIKDNEKFTKYDAVAKRNYNTQLLRKWGNAARRIDREKMYYPLFEKDGVVTITEDDNPPSSEYRTILPILPDGTDGRWRWGKSTMQKNLDRIEIVFNDDGSYVAYEKIYEPLENEVRTKKFATWIETDEDIWLSQKGSTAEGTKELKSLFDGTSVFAYPKPISLIDHLMKIGNVQDGDIILDPFAGSGTTGQSVLFANLDGAKRKFILCEQMDYAQDITAERLYRSLKSLDSDDSFIYMELKVAAQKYIDTISNATTSEQLLEILHEIKKSMYLNYTASIKKIDDSIDEFLKLSFKEQQEFLLELIDKNLLYVNYSDSDDSYYNVSSLDKQLTTEFYQKEVR